MKTSRAKSKSLDNLKTGSTAKSSRKNKRVYCLCKGPDDGRFMIGCDSCNDWFHVGCVGMSKARLPFHAVANKLTSFTCPPCARKNDKSIVSPDAAATGAVTTKRAKKSAGGDKKMKAKAEAKEEVQEEEVKTKPKRVAKRTRKTPAAPAAPAKSSKKRRRVDEEEDDDDEEGAEYSSEHNESEVEDRDDDGEDGARKNPDEDAHDDDDEEEHVDDEESTYEQERKQRMEENQQFLRSLGLLDAKKSLGLSSFSAASGTSRKYTGGKRHRWSAGDAADAKGDDSFEGDDEGLTNKNGTGALPVRKSRRLQNEPALDYSQIKEEVVKELAERPVVGRRGRGAVFAQSRGFHGNGRVPATEHIVAPFSLASVGTTIWSLGRIYEGDASPEKYYSSKQCMYRHPYPVGYRASIVKWGSVWIMEIHEGSDGPRFVVRQKKDDEAEDGTPLAQTTDEQESEAKPEEEEEKGHESFDGEEAEQQPQQQRQEGEQEHSAEEEPKQEKKRKKTFKRFEGPSATQPWTKACINGPSPGSRVSGPLLYGFSDPLTVHVLNRLRKAAQE